VGFAASKLLSAATRSISIRCNRCFSSAFFHLMLACFTSIRRQSNPRVLPMAPAPNTTYTHTAASRMMKRGSHRSRKREAFSIASTAGVSAIVIGSNMSTKCSLRKCL